MGKLAIRGAQVYDSENGDSCVGLIYGKAMESLTQYLTDNPVSANGTVFRNNTGKEN